MLRFSSLTDSFSRHNLVQGEQSPWFWLGIGLAAVLLCGLFIDVMDVDASQYASISMEMLQNGSWLEVQHRGADYLDKPPLLFWLSTASFSLFGISNWAYKLPSLLAAFAGIWGVYRFCLIFYSPKTARQAAFILASSLGLIIICNDVRTDTLLLGTTTCAIWQLAEYGQRPRWRYLFGGFFCMGLAMLAKGPIGIVVPGFAIGTHLLLSGQWRAIFKWQWLIGLTITAIVLTPMCWGLWHQFDIHPEKLINDRMGVSGLYFFFWEQSFGRVTGANVWRNDASAFYFLHVYLWAFLPWCLLLPGALWQQAGTTFGKFFTSRKFHAPSRKFHAPPTPPFEYYTLGAFVLSFLALSSSQYKLPHYIFITLPWAAVLVAHQINLEKMPQSSRRWRWIGLYFAIAIGMLIAFMLPGFVFPTGEIAVWGILLSGTLCLVWKVFSNPFPQDTDVLVQRGVWVAILIGFVLNFHFYPNLLPYQAAKSVAKFAKENNISATKVAYFHRGSHALDFYNGDILEAFEQPKAVREHAQSSGTFWIHADEAGKGELELSDVRFEVVKTFQHFHVATLNLAFLSPSKRASTLETIYLLKILAAQD